MLIPRFSLRWLLVLVTLCAGGSLILAAAVRGEHWAVAAAVGLGSAAIVVGFHVLAFLSAWLVAEVGRGAFPSSMHGTGVSPFGPGEVTTSPFGPPAPAVETPTSDSPPSLTG